MENVSPVLVGEPDTIDLQQEGCWYGLHCWASHWWAGGQTAGHTLLCKSSVYWDCPGIVCAVGVVARKTWWAWAFMSCLCVPSALRRVQDAGLSLGAGRGLLESRSVCECFVVNAFFLCHPPQSSGNASYRCSMSSSADFSDEDDFSQKSGSASPAPGDTLPWNLPKHERSKRKIHGGSVLDPAERAVLRIAGKGTGKGWSPESCRNSPLSSREGGGGGEGGRVPSASAPRYGAQIGAQGGGGRWPYLLYAPIYRWSDLPCLLVTKLFGPVFWLDESIPLKCKELFTHICIKLSYLHVVATVTTSEYSMNSSNH